MNKISPNVFAKDSPSRIIPGLRYRNAIQAIEWMCSAPGFEHRSVYLNSDGTVALAKLTFGSGMKLVGSASNQLEYAQFAAHPDKFSGREIRSISLVSWDVEGLYGRVKASGAQMVFDLAKQLNGATAFTCRDPEGYLWNIGFCDPWVDQ